MDYIWKKPLTLLEGGGCHGDLPGGVCASREEWKSFVKHSTADMRRCAQKKQVVLAHSLRVSSLQPGEPMALGLWRALLSDNGGEHVV